MPQPKQNLFIPEKTSFQKFLPRRGPVWLSLVYRIILWCVALSVPIVNFKIKRSIEWIHVCDWGLFLSITSSSVGIIHYLFIEDKNNSILTTIYTYLFTMTFSIVSLFTACVWINNLMDITTIFQGVTYLTSIEHVVLGLMTPVPFLFEYIEFKWFPYYWTTIILYASYSVFNMIYVLSTGKEIYHYITWKNVVTYAYIAFLGLAISASYGVCFYLSRWITKKYTLEKLGQEYEIEQKKLDRTKWVSDDFTRPNNFR